MVDKINTNIPSLSNTSSIVRKSFPSGLKEKEKNLGDKKIDFQQDKGFELFDTADFFEACISKKEHINQLLKPIFKEPVFNYSGDFPFLWDEIKIPIQYGSNYEKAKVLFIEIAKKTVGDLTDVSQEKWFALQKEFLLENAQTEPMVTLIANDNWVEFTLRYVVNFRKRRITKSELFTQILTEVEKTNGEIKFASATFHLIETPEINVSLSKKN